MSGAHSFIHNAGKVTTTEKIVYTEESMEDYTTGIFSQREREGDRRERKRRKMKDDEAKDRFVEGGN